MSSLEFDIVFRGDIVFGHQLADVKNRLQQLFKVDAAKVDGLFTGRPIPLKRNLDEQTAKKYRDALMNAGALVELVASEKILSSPTVQPRVSKAPAQAGPKNADWTVAPAGTSLLVDSPIQSVNRVAIDTSSFSLSAPGSNLLKDTEVKPPIPAKVVIPNFDLAEVGVNLIRADEKPDLPVIEIEFEAWDIAELGSDLLQAHEQAPITTVNLDLSHYNLAPVGSDLGQLKPKVEIVTPDISGIKLVDTDT